MLLFSAVEGQVPKNLSHPLPKAAHLDKAGLDGVPETDSDEQEDQDIVPIPWTQPILAFDTLSSPTKIKTERPNKPTAPENTRPAHLRTCKTDAHRASVSSVLLPERLTGHAAPPCTFGTRFRVSPELHPHPVLIPSGDT